MSRGETELVAEDESNYPFAKYYINGFALKNGVDVDHPHNRHSTEEVSSQ